MDYLIEARHENHGNNWDSDYVGSSQNLHNIRTVKKVLRELCTDPDWAGWEFRALRCVDGCYDEQVAYDVNELGQRIEEEN